MNEKTFICDYGHETKAIVGNDILNILCHQCGMIANVKSKDTNLPYFTNVVSGTVDMGNSNSWLNH